MSDDLIFEEPPPTGAGRPAGQTPFGQWVDALRSHPGQWARYPERVGSNYPSLLKHGGRWGAQAGEFEAVTRRSGKDRCDLYARYIGTVEP